MAYRNGVYVAFDGQGTTNPTKSDIRYYNLLNSWVSGEHFSYIDSHQKTRSVRDSSKEETLKRVLRERLSDSKVMLLILSDETNYDRGFLNYEIEQSLDRYKLPLIIAYPDTNTPIENQWAKLEKRWPRALKARLADSNVDDSLSVLHVNFTKENIISALSHMSVHNKVHIGKKLVLQ
ncbi:TIR domain-containing protein [Sporosarcina sp.]|uniref:TIR domain-containing protein n=1 Tax=Sporosarcina sp. TaxID=49982 RepID=UPI0026237DF0|nr:TIR domain-containing protein [Sporosarcina sp.]